MPLTPTNYLNSVIYKIEHTDNPELIYIGSTTNFIKRKYNHKKCCNNENDRDYNKNLYNMIRKNGGFNEFKIMIIKKYPCNNKTELLIEEEKNRKEYQANLNSCRAYRTNEEKKEQQKEFRENNKEQIKEYIKEYRENNKEQIKEQIKEYQKKYNEDNKDKKKEQLEEYYKQNKEQIKEYQKKYRKQNKEQIKEYQKEYRNLKKEQSI